MQLIFIRGVNGKRKTLGHSKGSCQKGAFGSCQPSPKKHQSIVRTERPSEKRRFTKRAEVIRQNADMPLGEKDPRLPASSSSRRLEENRGGFL